jgi:hypothetical protein
MRRFAKKLLAGALVGSALAAGSASAFWNDWGGGPWGGGGPWYGGGYPYYGGWGGYPGYGGWGGYPSYGTYAYPTTTTKKSSSKKADKK